MLTILTCSKTFQLYKIIINVLKCISEKNIYILFVFIVIRNKKGRKRWMLKLSFSCHPLPQMLWVALMSLRIPERVVVVGGYCQKGLCSYDDISSNIDFKMDILVWTNRIQLDLKWVIGGERPRGSDWTNKEQTKCPWATDESSRS